MLNGIDPIIIITFMNKGIISRFQDDSIIGMILNNIGIPIPIYLSESLTGIYIDSETRSIDARTEVQPTVDKGIDGQPATPEVTQTVIDNQVTVNMLANKDSTMLTVLIGMMEQISKYLVSAEYKIHYIHGPIVVFGALISRFSTSVNSNDDLVHIEMTLSTAKKEQPTPKSGPTPVAKVGTQSLSTPPR